MILTVLIAGVLTAGTGQQASDWLIDPKPYTTENVERPGTVELSNGLVRRVWRTVPAGACVALDNLVTGESLLRAVKPEATVTIDEREYEVGGLAGQPDHAYLTDDWLGAMTPRRGAMVLTGVRAGEIEKRMEWARVRHAAPGAEWPPGNRALHFMYELPPPEPAEGVESAFGREVLLDDRFAVVDGAWRVRASSADARTSFENEGKPGEIRALTGTHCFAERALPAGAALVEVEIDPGTDRAGSWGPGVGLVFDGRVVEVNLRPGDRGEHGHFELRDNGAEQLATVERFKAGDGGLDTGRAYVLRARFDGADLVWDAAPAGGMNWYTIRASGPKNDG